MKTLIRWLFDRPLKKEPSWRGDIESTVCSGWAATASHILPKNLEDPVSASSSSRENKAWTSAGWRSFNREAEICGNWICLPRPVYMRCFERPASGLS
ncbi:hypothetical protein PO124_23975 [Bacillus licheniformis]|nr:hypothetical protein [Bacillus licheniformis]